MVKAVTNSGMFARACRGLPPPPTQDALIFPKPHVSLAWPQDSACKRPFASAANQDKRRKTTHRVCGGAVQRDLIAARLLFDMYCVSRYCLAPLPPFAPIEAVQHGDAA